MCGYSNLRGEWTGRSSLRLGGPSSKRQKQYDRRWSPMSANSDQDHHLVATFQPMHSQAKFDDKNHTCNK